MIKDKDGRPPKGCLRDLTQEARERKGMCFTSGSLLILPFAKIATFMQSNASEMGDHESLNGRGEGDKIHSLTVIRKKL